MTQFRALIVDDSEDSAEVLACLLEDEGHQALTALDGARALALVQTVPVDVVILDLYLPDIDGFELAIQIRQRMGQHVRIVAFTGYSGAAYRERAERSGIDAFVTKPFEHAKLAALLGANTTATRSEQPRSRA